MYFIKINVVLIMICQDFLRSNSETLVNMITNHAQDNFPVSTREVSTIKNLDNINKYTSKSLSFGTFFYNCNVFSLRGLSKHKTLQAEQYIVSTSNAGILKITFSVTQQIHGVLWISSYVL